MYLVYYGRDYLHDPRTDDVELTSATVEVELNASGSFTFEMHAGHPLYDAIAERDTANPVKVYQDGELIFCGDILSIETDFYLTKKVECRSELGWLNDSIVRPYSTLNNEHYGVAPSSVDGYFEWLIESHNAQVESTKRFVVGINEGSLLDKNNYILRSDTTYPNTGSVIKEKIIESLGGYVRVRHEGGVRYIDLLADFPKVNEQMIDFGVNLLDYDATDATEDMATFVVPLGAKMSETAYSYDDGYFKTSDTSVVSGKDYYTKSDSGGYSKCSDLKKFESGKTYYEYDELEDEKNDKLTISSLRDGSVSYPDICKSGDIVYSEGAVAKYGWIGAVVEFNAVTIAENLLDNGVASLRELLSPVKTLELTAVDLSMIDPDHEPIYIGHYVRARSKPHGFDSYMMCSKIKFYLNSPEDNVFTLGMTWDAISGLQNKRINSLNATINTIYQAADQISAEAKAAAILAYQADSKAEQAQQTATSSSEVSAEALASATSAAEKADAAQSTADAASEAATTAGTAASEAKSQAEQALADATAAAQEAATAKAAADEATANVTLMETQVSQAVQDAADAKSEAAAATESAEEATSAATAAQTAAQEAKAQAEAAQAQAEAADTAAAEAKADAADAIAAQAEVNAKIATIEGEIDSVTEDAAELRTDLEGQITAVTNTMTADYAKKTELTETTATLRAEIETSAAGIRQEVSSDYAKKTELTSVESSLQTQITQNADSITSTASKVETIEINVEKVQEDADAAQAAADAAQADADQAAADAAQAQADATAAAQAATAAQSAADAADAAAAAAQAKADAAQDDLDDAKANLEAVTSRVGATEEEIAEAQAKVNAAQSAADSAAAEAATAKSTADSAAATASNAQQAAAGAQSVANAAAADAADAQAKADNAVAVANGASSEAAEAYAKAQAANETAAAAQATANTAKTNADKAVADASAAQTAADEAQAAADKAQEDLATANSELATAKQNLANVTSRVGATEAEIAEAQAAVEAAQADADAAATAAANAQSTADTAKANAATAQSAANQAKSDAAAAQSAADAAQDAADQAQADVNALTNRVTIAETKITQNTEAIALRATKTEVTETLGGYYTKSEADAAIQVSADSITQSVSSTYATKTELNNKANDYTILLYNGTGGNPKPVKFATVNYSTCGSENGVCIKISMVSGHGNGTSYAFLQDAIIRVNHNGGVEVDNVKHYGAETPTYDNAVRQYGDIFWVIDTTNKIVDFYCLMGQYARVYQTPWKRLTYSTGGTVTQYTSCTVYSSGTKVWANNSDIALMTDITELSTRIDQTESSITLCATKTELTTVSDAASAAQSTANTAKTNAATAQSAAEAAQSTANTANSTANTAKTNAATAQTTANNAATAASNAQSAADDAQDAADAAQSTANTANSTANSVKTDLANNYYTKTQTDAQIKVSADSITSTVSSTYATKTALASTDTKAANAATAAATAQTAANSAQSAADAAQAAADSTAEVAGVLVENMESLLGDGTEGNRGSIFELSSQISQTNADWSAAFSKTETEISGINTEIGEIKTDVSEYATWFTMNEDGLTIGKTEDGVEQPLKVRLDNDSLDFMDNDTVVAYVSNEKLMINAAEVKGSLDVGGFRWTTRSNGNMGLMWIGG